MKSRRLVFGCLVALGLLLGLLAGRRALEVLPYPIGTGDSKKSPDGRYEAFITDWHDESFFGRSRQWFEFEVRGGTPPSGSSPNRFSVPTLGLARRTLLSFGQTIHRLCGLFFQRPRFG
jgi:hypothetical protein